MNWLCQRRSSIFFFILTLAIGFSIYFVLPEVSNIPPQPFKGSIDDAIKACGSSRVPSLVTLLNKKSIEKDVTSLQVGSITLTVKDIRSSSQKLREEKT